MTSTPSIYKVCLAACMQLHRFASCQVPIHQNTPVRSGQVLVI